MAEELVLGRCRYRDAITGKIRVMKWHVTEEDIHARLGDRVIARVEGSRQSGGPIRKGIVRGSWGAGARTAVALRMVKLLRWS